MAQNNNELEKTLWAAADKLRNNMDAAEYKHKFADKGEVLVSVRAPVGDINIATERICIGRGVASLKINNGMHDFLFYLLKANVSELINKESGTVFGSINKDDLFSLRVKVPESVEVQLRISSILSSFDEKIELNRQTNRTLESIAQAIYKEWFINFNFPCLPENYEFSGARKPEDISKACTYKAVGGLPAPQANKYFIYVLICNDESFYIGITDDLYRRWYEHKTGQGAKWTKSNEPVKVIHYEEYQTRQEAAEREQWLKTGFGRKWLKREYEKMKKAQTGSPVPESKLRQAGEMQDSELGPIPKGWRVGKVKDLVEIQSGFAFKGDSFIDAGNYKIITIKNVQDGLFDSTKTICIDNIPERMPEFCKLNERDILLSLTGNVGRICFVYGQNMLLNQRVAKLWPKDQSYFGYVYTYFRSESVKNDLISLGKGTAQQNLSPIETQNKSMIMPPREILLKYGKIANPLYEMFIHNLVESQYLTETRDNLLPKLMSGEIEV
ncbi:MAG: restriction endonuclease subunit S [Candidatus Omnitrophica bacterium]|nr:restriction endonuclease subunit S [Candidatus Omnitrophota bacterium]